MEGRAAGRPGPVPPGERIVVVDAIRGVAVLGILLVNMLWFAGPEFYLRPAGIEWWTDSLDRAVRFFIRLAAEGKFLSTFSFLFGLGFAIQMGRTRSRETPFGPLYLRRLLGLLAIGLGHAILVWHGDILMAYAVLGGLLYFFRDRDETVLVPWAAVMLLAPVLLAAGVTALTALAALSPEGAQHLEAQLVERRDLLGRQAERSVEAYREGGYAEALDQRLVDLRFLWRYFFLWLPPNFALFLAGLYAGRMGLFRGVDEHASLLRRVVLWGFLLGGPANLVYAWARLRGVATVDGSLAGFVASAAHTLGAPLLALGYVGALTLLLHGRTRRGEFRPLAAVGRMALTNYLAQSVLCTAIFYGYGLGLYGRVRPAEGLLLTLAIWALQLAWSPWWLQHFRYGPVEWAWRSLTYGRLEPFRTKGAIGGT